MSSFLVVFLSIYTLMHALVYFSIRVIFAGKWLIQALCVLFALLMIVAPIGARLLERGGHVSLAHATAWVAFPWMGSLFLAFCAFLVRGILIVSTRLVNHLAGVTLPTFDGRISAVAVLIAVALVSVYGFFEARSIRTEHVEIKTDKLPEGVDRLRIAQISDVHLGLMVREDRLKKILEKVRIEKPDILVCTGDLVDGSFGQLNHLPQVFDSVQPRLGKYAVTGNHEVYAGQAFSLESIKSFGFKVLRDEYTRPGGVINIVGVDDPAAGVTIDEPALLSSARNGLFTLLLKHRPSAPAESQGLYDLQLSGHTHRGQIFPFNFVTGIFYPMQDGLYELANGSRLYTNRGSGTWGPPMRVLAPPEITIIELVRK
jgi:predicted MPP superfamily phosphohydrolase